MNWNRIARVGVMVFLMVATAMMIDRADLVIVDARTHDEEPSRPVGMSDADWGRAFADRMSPGDEPMQFCFAEGTPHEFITAFCEANPLLCGVQDAGAPRFDFAFRWSGTLGTPRNLTWSLVPDGVAITSVGGASNQLFAQMDAQFANNGGRAVWVGLIQQCFDRWAALTGLSYTRITSGGNDWDDGAAWGSGGNANRGDIRIACVPLDGPSNTLAFNSFPSGSTAGDMVLDSAENWDSTSNNFRFMRDIIMHEHGHGIGMAHICPTIGGTSGRLLEPLINTNIDGPQHDDIRAAQFAYGDAFESNNTSGSATDLGIVNIGQTVTPGTIPSPNTTFPSSLLSISSNGDQDFYRITTTVPASISVTVTPVGFTYDSSPQACPGNFADCCSGNNVNSLTQANLDFQVLGSNGASVLATANSQAAGVAESVTNVVLGGAGNYFIRVFESGSPTETQFYNLQFTIQSANVQQAVITLPNGAPPTLLPGVETTFLVDINPNDAVISPGSQSLIYNFGGGNMIQPLVSIGGNQYEATFPVPTCSDTPTFSIAAQVTLAGSPGIVRLPEDGLNNPFTAVVASASSEIFSDNGEANEGWSVSGSASAGAWGRGTPVGGGDRGDPAMDFDNSGQCWLTSNIDGDSDVDGGNTILTSVPIDLSDGGLISYAYWINDIGDFPFDAGDGLTVEIATNAAGSNWTILRTYSSPIGAWQTDSIDIGGEVAASSTIRIRFTATDAGAGSVVEAGLDAIEASTFACSDAPLPPDAPTGVSASDASSCDTISVAWNAVAEADDYDVYRNTIDDSGTAALLQSGVVGTNFDDLTASPGTTYFYWVQACNAGGCSGFSTPTETGSLIDLPVPVTGLDATDDLCGAVQVTWSDVPDAVDYEVFAATTDDFGSAVSLGTSNVASFEDSTAAIGTTYFYFVTVTTACGTSDESGSTTGEVALTADMNRDGVVNALDIQGFVNAALGAFDACGDLEVPFDVIDDADTAAFVSLLLGI